jgi:hypothetical protein
MSEIMKNVKNINLKEDEKRKKIMNGVTESYILSEINNDKFGEYVMNWFYILEEVLYIKKKKKDFWFTHSIPLVTIYAIEPLNEGYKFEIRSLYVNIKCDAENEETYEKWFKELTSKMKNDESEKNIDKELEKLLILYYKKNEQDLKNFTKIILENIMKVSNKLGINEKEMNNSIKEYSNSFIPEINEISQDFFPIQDNKVLVEKGIPFFIKKNF